MNSGQVQILYQGVRGCVCGGGGGGDDDVVVVVVCGGDDGDESGIDETDLHRLQYAHTLRYSSRIPAEVPVAGICRRNFAEL